MYKGTSADPETFMSARELTLSQDYSREKFTILLATPLEWIILLFVLVLGISRKFEKWSKETTKISVLQVAIYFFLFIITDNSACLYRCNGLAGKCPLITAFQRKVHKAG